MSELPIPPGFLTRWCENNAADGEHPAQAYLGTGLVMMSTVLAPKLRVHWSSTHEEMANLWVVGVGDSGSGKTTIGSSLGFGVDAARQILGDRVQSLSVSRMSSAALVEHLDVMGPLVEAAKRRERAAAKAEGRDPEPVIVEEPDPPYSHVLRLNELGSLWGAAPGERSSSYVDEARQVLLSVFDGKLSSHTKATNVIDQACCVNAVGMIPTSELRDRTTIQTIASGFAGRWAILPMPEKDRLVATPQRNGEDPRRAIQGEVMRLCNLFQDSETVYINDLLTEDGRAARDEWYERMEGQYDKSDGDEIDRGLYSLWSRMQGTALKIAPYVQISNDLCKPVNERLFDLKELRVGRASMLWAQLVVEQAITQMHDMAIEQAPSRNKVDVDDEGRVLQWLTSKGHVDEDSAVSQRDLKRALFQPKVMRNRGLTDWHIQGMLKSMATMGTIVATTENRGKVMLYAPRD